MLSWYVERFDTVEVNNSLYRLPTASALALLVPSDAGEFLFRSESQPLHHP